MALEDDVRDMARLPLFQEIEPDALRLLAFSAETRILRMGDVLFRKGEPSQDGFFVLSGSFQIEDPAHPEMQKIISPFSLIGEMALFTNTERPATIIAREPATVMQIGRHVFHRVMKEYPKSAQKARASIEARLTALTKTLAHEGF